VLTTIVYYTQAMKALKALKRASEAACFGERTHSTTAGSHNPSSGKSASSSEGTQGGDVTTRSGCMPNDCPTPLLLPS
jgi:hypothetical protein